MFGGQKIQGRPSVTILFKVSLCTEEVSNHSNVLPEVQRSSEEPKWKKLKIKKENLAPGKKTRVEWHKQSEMLSKTESHSGIDVSQVDHFYCFQLTFCNFYIKMLEKKKSTFLTKNHTFLTIVEVHITLFTFCASYASWPIWSHQHFIWTTTTTQSTPADCLAPTPSAVCCPLSVSVSTVSLPLSLRSSVSGLDPSIRWVFVFICEQPAPPHYHENGLSPLLIRRVSVVINVFIQTLLLPRGGGEEGTENTLHRRKATSNVSPCPSVELLLWLLWKSRIYKSTAASKNPSVSKTKKHFWRENFSTNSLLRQVKCLRLLLSFVNNCFSVLQPATRGRIMPSPMCRDKLCRSQSQYVWYMSAHPRERVKSSIHHNPRQMGS